MSRSWIQSGSVLAIAVLSAAPVMSQTTVYVDAARPPGGNGQSWTEAFHDLGEALDASAGLPGEVSVWVAAGLYRPDRGGLDRDRAFELRPHLSIYGGFAGSETELEQRDWAAHPVVLSGDLLDNDAIEPESIEDPSLADNSYHVVSTSGEGASGVLDGVTVTGGAASHKQDVDSRYRGGGLLARGGDAVVRNSRFERCWARDGGAISGWDDAHLDLQDCDFISNRASGGGGAVLLIEGGTLTLARCTFRQNRSGFTGGAIKLQSVDEAITAVDCVFEGNWEVSSNNGEGGAVSTQGYAASFTGCVFTGNTAARGGAISSVWGDIEVLGCRFEGNESNGFDGGGAIYLYMDVLTKYLVEDSEFVDNKALLNGGAVYLETIGVGVFVDCLFENNRAKDGGALVLESSGHIVERCTFIGNKASRGGGLRIFGDTTVIDCLFQGNLASYGGGIEAEGRCDVRGSSFVSNTASYGGGFYSHRCLSLHDRCVFQGNTATTDGGAVMFTYLSVASVYNSLITGNSAARACGGIRVTETTSAVLVSSTVVANSAVKLGGGLSVDATSYGATRGSLVWYNRDQEGDGEASQIRVTTPGVFEAGYSSIKAWSGQWGGVANDGLEPLFMDEVGPDGQPGTGDEDWSLRAGSPSIDSGDNTALIDGMALDVVGSPRFVDDPSIPDTGEGTAPLGDRGAYERQPVPCWPDLDLSGTLDLFDFLAFVNLFNGGDASADCDGNDDLDLFDLLCFVNAFNTGC